MYAYTLFKKIIKRILRKGSPNELLTTWVQPYTIVGSDRLESILGLVKEVTGHNIPGDFLETGTYRGGTAALLALRARQEGWKRDVHLFDSFQGHPADSRSQNAPDRHLFRQWAGKLVASPEEVRRACRRVRSYDPQHVHIHAGWVEDTLPASGISQVAFAHLDVDWYEPTKLALEYLLPRMASGAAIQVDDYNYMEGVRHAVDEFVAAHPGKILFSGTVSVAAILRIR